MLEGFFVDLDLLTELDFCLFKSVSVSLITSAENGVSPFSAAADSCVAGTSSAGTSGSAAGFEANDDESVGSSTTTTGIDSDLTVLPFWGLRF